MCLKISENYGWAEVSWWSMYITVKVKTWHKVKNKLCQKYLQPQMRGSVSSEPRQSGAQGASLRWSGISWRRTPSHCQTSAQYPAVNRHDPQCQCPTSMMALYSSTEWSPLRWRCCSINKVTSAVCTIHLQYVRPHQVNVQKDRKQRKLVLYQLLVAEYVIILSTILLRWTIVIAWIIFWYVLYLMTVLVAENNIWNTNIVTNK